MTIKKGWKIFDRFTREQIGEETYETHVDAVLNLAKMQAVTNTLGFPSIFARACVDYVNGAGARSETNYTGPLFGL